MGAASPTSRRRTRELTRSVEFASIHRVPDLLDVRRHAEGVILVHEFVAAQPQLQAWGLKPFADPEAEFNRLDATNNTTADGEVDWDEFLAWAVEHKLDRDDDDSDDESLLQAADVKKRPSVQKASELQK